MVSGHSADNGSVVDIIRSGNTDCLSFLLHLHQGTEEGVHTGIWEGLIFTINEMVQNSWFFMKTKNSRQNVPQKT